MKKLFFFLLIAAIGMHACTNESELKETEMLSGQSQIVQTHEFQLPLETAIDNLWSIIDHMEGKTQTRNDQIL